MWLPRSPASRCCLGGGRGTSVACGSWGGSLRCPLQGQVHPHFSFFFPSSSSIWDSGLRRLASQLQFSGVLTHPLHVPSRIDGGELPGVSMLRPRVRLAAPGCLLGWAPWRSVCCSAGIPATHIE